MGKRAIVTKATMQSPAVDGSQARPEPVSTAWIDNLTPEEKAIHEKKKEENLKKAQKAQLENLSQNKYREEEERRAQKVMREKLLQEKKENSQLEIVIAKAKEEGVVEASALDSEGVWWAEVEVGKWQVAKESYLCTACGKHLNDWTLEYHINSAAHKKNVSSCAATQPTLPTPLSGLSRPTVPTPCCSPTPCRAASTHETHGPEEWQKVVNGVSLCIPCNDKVIDQWHLDTRIHQSRLDYWLQQKDLERRGWPAPSEDYYAYVPREGGGRVMMCLLCSKSGCIGTEVYEAEVHEAAKLHTSRLREYSLYAAQISELKAKYHPEVRTQERRLEEHLQEQERFSSVPPPPPVPTTAETTAPDSPVPAPPPPPEEWAGMPATPPPTMPSSPLLTPTKWLTTSLPVAHKKSSNKCPKDFQTQLLEKTDA